MHKGLLDLFGKDDDCVAAGAQFCKRQHSESITAFVLSKRARELNHASLLSLPHHMNNNHLHLPSVLAHEASHALCRHNAEQQGECTPRMRLLPCVALLAVPGFRAMLSSMSLFLSLVLHVDIGLSRGVGTVFMQVFARFGALQP